MDVGMKVYERESADANHVVASDIFAVGMPFKARRGPVGVAVPFYSPSQDRRIWGELGPMYQAGYVRRGVFANCSEYGAKIYGVRVVGTGSVVATVTLGTTWIVSSGYLGLDSPGADGNNVWVELKANAADPTGHRDLVVSYQGPKDSAPAVVETFTYLDSTNVVNTVNSRSLFIKVALSAPGAAVPPVAVIAQLASGVDGTAPVLTDYTTALSAFDGAPISIILNPDYTSLLAAQALQTYVEGRGDLIGIHNSPQGMSITTLTTTYAPMLKAKSYMAGYRAWGQVDDGYGGYIDVPLMGHVVGAGYIRQAMLFGGFPWIAPAGQETALRDVVNLYDPNYSDGDLNACVRTAGFNPVMYMPGYSFIIRTSRTMSSMRKYYSVHVRRLTNWLLQSFRASFFWVEQKGNSEKTRGLVADSLKMFSRDIYRNGGFNTNGGFDNNVAIKCDNQNNTQTMVDNGELQCDYIFHPVECIESGQINVMQTRDGLTVTEK